MKDVEKISASGALIGEMEPLRKTEDVQPVPRPTLTDDREAVLEELTRQARLQSRQLRVSTAACSVCVVLLVSLSFLHISGSKLITLFFASPLIIILCGYRL